MRIRNIEPLHSVNNQFSGETRKHEVKKDRDNKKANICRIQSNVYISTIDSGRYGTQRPLHFDNTRVKRKMSNIKEEDKKLEGPRVR